MKTNTVFLLLNGEQPNQLPDLSAYSLVCATDGAYRYLEQNEIVPDFISGDFDSLGHQPEGIEVINTPDQDFTDFDKVLQLLFDKGYSDIHIYGASGKEQDHFLGNLHTAIQWNGKLNLTFFDNYGYYLLADKQMTLSNIKGKTVSLVPFPEATGIITHGLQYPLMGETLTFGQRIGTRNVAQADEVNLSFGTGHLFVFVNEKV